jgi:hypothetical protein
MRARTPVGAIAAAAICIAGITVAAAGGARHATPVCGGTPPPNPIVTPVECQSYVAKASNVVFAAKGFAPGAPCTILWGDGGQSAVVASSAGYCAATHVYQVGGTAPLYRMTITLNGIWLRGISVR